LELIPVHSTSKLIWYLFETYLWIVSLNFCINAGLQVLH
jgi:hypothetical protein